MPGTTSRHAIQYPVAADTVASFPAVQQAAAERTDLRMPIMGGGAFSGTTDVNGDQIIAHGLGSIPTAAQVCGAGTSLPANSFPTIRTMDSTSIVVRWLRTDSAGVLASNPVQGQWLAFR